MNTVQVYDVGKSRSLVDQFVLLGFGTSGKELAKNYTVNATGEDIVKGRNTTRLELVPRSAKVKEQITKVELWIPLDAGHPVQQKFYQPGGDYYLVTYSDVQLNPNLPDDAFRLKLPANVKREYPQK
jgi:outer membrane lipoprotein-sorting protein